MEEAIKAAKASRKIGEYCIGSIVADKDGNLISIGYNGVILESDPTAHCEVNAIRAACKKLGTRHLTDCILISTIEPCILCTGTALWARMGMIIHGAYQGDIINHNKTRPKNSKSKFNWVSHDTSCEELIDYCGVEMQVIGGIKRNKCLRLFHW